MTARLLSALLLAVFALLPNRSWAGDDFRKARMSPLRVDGAPTLLRHEFSAECEGADDMHCAIVVRWTLPPSDAPRRAVVYLLEANEARVTIDGRPVAAMVEPSDEPSWLGAFIRVGVVVPPSQAPVTLGLRSDLRLVPDGPRCAMGMSWPLAEVRHITQIPVSLSIDLGAELGDPDEDPPRATFDGDVEIRIDAPQRWRFSGAPRPVDGRHTWTQTRPWISGTDRAVIHGPVIGAGARFPRRREARPWLRGGWEFSALHFMTHTLAVESDLRNMLVVPSTEIGTGAVIILPSLSVGVGAPLRLAPAFRPGVRVYGGLNFPYVSVIGGYDHFPRYRGGSVERLGFIGLQFSL